MEHFIGKEPFACDRSSLNKLKWGDVMCSFELFLKLDRHEPKVAQTSPLLLVCHPMESALR